MIPDPSEILKAISKGWGWKVGTPVDVLATGH